MMRYWIAAIAALGLVAAFDAPEVQAASARCEQAKTCSQARDGCRRNCIRTESTNCMQFCSRAFQQCLQTGTFNAVWCGPMPGLRKR